MVAKIKEKDVKKKVNKQEEEKDNKKKLLLLLLLFVLIMGISITFGKNILDTVSDQILEVLDLNKPGAPVITGGSNEWSKERVIKVEKDATSKVGLSYYEYCINSEKSTKKCNWIKTITKNVKVVETGTYYVTFRGVDKEGNTGKNSNTEVVYIDNNNPVIKNIEIKEKTSSSIKIEVEAKDNHSGIDKYMYSLDEKNYEEGKLSYTYKNLESNKEYVIYIKIVDKVGNITELSMPVKTLDKDEEVKPTPTETPDSGDDKETKCELNCDTDNDGKCDLNCDTNNDGKCDLNCDTNDNGKCDLNCDTDEDGKCDMNCDTDNDGKCDLNCDTNDNGKCDLNCDTDEDGKCDMNCDTDNDGKCDENCSDDEDDLVVPDLNLDKVPSEFLYGDNYSLPSYYKFGPSGGVVECLVDGIKEEDTTTLGIGSHVIECTAKGNNGINIRVSKKVEVKVNVGLDEVWNGWIRLNLYYPENSTNWQWRLGKEGEIRSGYDSTGWQDYTGPILVKLEDVNDVYIRYTINGETYVVAPSGKVAVSIEPEKYTLKTSEKTKVEIYYDKDASIKEYKIGNGEWQEYTGLFEVGVNTIIEARATKEEKVYDSDGNYVYTSKRTSTDSVFISEYVNNESSGGSSGGSGDGAADGSVGSGTTSGGTSGSISYTTTTSPTGEKITTLVSESKPSTYLIGPTISSSPSTEIVESVKITVTPQEEAEKIYISVNENSYEEYTESVEVTDNVLIKAYYVRKSDGKVSDVTYYYVQNIKEGNKPYVRIDADPNNYLSETQEKVEVSISGSNYDTLEYSLDGEIYEDYTGSLLVTESSTVYARGRNSYGTTVEKLTIPTTTVSEIKEELSIDIFANPESSNKLINSTEVSIVYDNRATKKYYKLAGESEYKEYTGPFEIRENTTIYAYATGENASGSSKKGIDFLTTGIMEPIISVTPTESTSVVTVSITFDSKATKQYFQINGGERLYYTGPFEVYENSEIYAYNSNTLGYEAESNYEIDNIVTLPKYLVIDKEKYFIIKLNYPEESTLREYKWKQDGEWKEYSEQGILLIKPEYKDEFDFESYDGIEVEDENGKKVIFTEHYYLIDVSFNELMENLFMRWDTAKPSAPEIVLNESSQPVKEVEVGIVYSTSLVEKYYKIVTSDGEDSGWLEYTGPFKVTENNVVIYVKGETFSEIESEVSSLKITNIDTIAPEIELKGDFTTPKQQVTVTVEATDNMMMSEVRWASGEQTTEYFKGNGTSIPNNGTFTVSENGKYTIYAVDQVGNEIVKTIEITNIDQSAPDIIINVLTERLTTKVEVSIDYGDSVTKEYRIGNSGSYQEYSENLIISSYDVYDLANSDGSLTIYAKGTDEVGNSVEVSEIIYILDLDIQDSPEIIPSDGYPMLTKDGMITEKESYIIYDTTRDDLMNYYRVDEGEWTLYTGPIVVKEGKIEAKSVKEVSGLTVTSEASVVIPTDAINSETYDEDLETIETIEANTVSKFTVLSNLAGRKIRFYFNNVPADDSKLKVYDIKGKELDIITLVSPVTLLEIPVDGYMVEISAGSSDLELKELTLREENELIDKSLSPVITIDNPEWTVEKVINIKYPEGNYTKEYSLDNGENWIEYSSPFTVEDNLTVLARVLKEEDVVSGSTFTVTMIDTEMPVVELNIASGIQLGYDQEIPTYYKVGKSGGSAECKVNDTVVTNINELKLGTHEIKCTVKNNAGRKSTVTKTVRIVETSDYVGDSILELLAREDIITGRYDLQVADEIYPVHVYVYDEDQHFTTDTIFGDSKDVGTADSYAKNMVIVKVNGDVTIDEGVTVGPYYTEYGGPKGFTLYVTGTLTNNGTLDNSHGAYAEGQDVYLWKNADGTYEYVPAVGATGGTGASGRRSGNAGNPGTDRQTGGGGAGGSYDYGISGSGGTGTSYSGGSGGGGIMSTWSGTTAESGSSVGGIGGYMSSSYPVNYGSGLGGAGNPGGSAVRTAKGEDGTGGLLTIYANGYINNGTITANGSNGAYTNSSYEVNGGGSSGGGSINIFTNQSTGINQLGIITDTRYSEILGENSLDGGAAVGSTYKGGAGGTGTINIGEIRNGQYYDLKEIIEQDKEAYIESVTRRGDSILSILKDNDLESGYYYFVANGEKYPVHLYNYDDDQIWTSDQTFGDSNDVSDGTNYSQNMVIVKVNGDVTIDEGVTVEPYYTAYGGPKGFTLYVTGTLTNNGTIDNSHGAYAEGQDVYLWKNADGTYEYVPAVGATGGASVAGSRSGNAGSPGTNRQTGGGGSGGAYSYGISGSGGTGTSYSGGAGGGGIYSSYTISAESGSSIGGSGGYLNNSHGSKGSGLGGAGNPGGSAARTAKGEDGTGGLLTIYANGYINNGTVSANGSNGAYNNSSYTVNGGGSSGGGSVNIFTNQSTGIDQLGIITDIRYSEILGETSLDGGAAVGSTYKGGAGGTGTINIGEIRNGQYYDLKEIIEQDKEAYIENVTRRGDSILSILKNNDLESGYYYFVVNGESYPVHLYGYDNDQHWTSDQTFGDSNDVSDGTNYSQNMVIVKINGDLTIDEGVTVGPYYDTQYGGPKGFTLYVTGTLTNNGTIDNSHGAYAEGQNVYLWKNADGTYEYVPAVGATGGASVAGSRSGNAGSPGTNRQTGGGGSGGAYSYGRSGSGGTGTSYSGGSGSGGMSSSYRIYATNGSSIGGSGGYTNDSRGTGVGGAGNPGGSSSRTVKGGDGTGGLLIIYADNYLNNGTVSAKGTNGGSKGGNYTVNGGGSSGGGSINIFYLSTLIEGTVEKDGGAITGHKYRGGAGGSGTVTYMQIPMVDIASSYVYPELTATIFNEDYHLVNIAYSSDLSNKLYSLDNGTTWLDYSEPFKVKSGDIVLGKGIYNDGTETSIITYTVPTPTDNLALEAYDNNLDTSTVITAGNNSIFTVTNDLVGSSLRIFLNNIPASDASIKIYDSSNTEILNTTFTENITVINIPENSYKIIINSGSSDLSISEINMRQITATGNNPIIETSSVEWTTSKLIMITYPEGYRNEYSLDLGETWLEYTNPITIDKETVILARTLENDKVISISSFTITMIDIFDPTITLEIPNEIVLQSEYELPTSYTVDESKSGGSAICKIGEEEIANTKDLAIGTYEITCTVTTGAGKEASVTKTLNVIDETIDIALDIPDSILVGSEYNLPTTVTGSTYSCKIGEQTVTNTKDLAVGTYEIVCSVTSIGGNTKEVTKTLEVYDETIDIALDIPDSILVGSEYNLPTSVTGNSYSCKIGDETVTNTKDLIVGTYEIICSVTSIGGNTKEVTKQVEVYEEETSIDTGESEVVEDETTTE